MSSNTGLQVISRILHQNPFAGLEVFPDEVYDHVVLVVDDPEIARLLVGKTHPLFLVYRAVVVLYVYAAYMVELRLRFVFIAYADVCIRF